MSLDRRLAVLSLFAGVVLLFLALGQFLAAQQMTRPASFLLLAGVVLVICYGLLAPTAVVDLVRSRPARFGSLSVLVSAIVVGVLVMVNALAARGTQAADLTAAHRFTLSPKSIAVLRQLDSDVTITGFFRPSTATASELADARSLLAEYRKASGHIKVKVVNPDTNPELARRLGVTVNGSFALQYKNRPPTVLLYGSQSEANFTTAILNLESSRTPQVCWAAGEGERDLNEAQDYGYSSAKGQLASSNFALKEVVLSQSADVPADCDIVAILGLQKPIAPPVAAAVQRYVERGGNLLFAVDPWMEAPVADSANALLKPYGAAFDNGLVAEGDPAHFAQGDNTTPVVFNYGTSPITKDLSNRLTFFPQATAIALTETSGVANRALAQSTASAYEIMSIRQANDLARRPVDRSGPFTIMATLEQNQAGGGQAASPSGGKRGRALLVGTAAFAENRAINAQAGYNRELLLAGFDWLAGNDQLIALPSRPPAAVPLMMSDQDYNLNFFLVVVGLPLLSALAGLAVYLRRRVTSVAAA